MRKIYVAPEYLKKLLYLLIGGEFRECSKEYMNKNIFSQELCDAHIFLSKDHMNTSIIPNNDSILILFDEALKKGYKPMILRESVLKEGFIYDPKAFYISIDLLSKFLVNKLELDENIISGSAEALKRLYDHAVGKARKISQEIKNESYRLIALTSGDYYVAKAAGLDIAKVYLDDRCVIIEDLYEETSDQIFFSLKQIYGETFTKCSDKIKKIYDKKIIVIDTSLSCYHLAPVITALTLRYELKDRVSKFLEINKINLS
ncbi:MAG: hypothetical protein LM581_04350 [Desulfurococcales archaeon]|nr:hypothetical protein [Desulfurococcales archaeon]